MGSCRQRPTWTSRRGHMRARLITAPHLVACAVVLCEEEKVRLRNHTDELLGVRREDWGTQNIGIQQHRERRAQRHVLAERDGRRVHAVSHGRVRRPGACFAAAHEEGRAALKDGVKTRDRTHCRSNEHSGISLRGKCWLVGYSGVILELRKLDITPQKKSATTDSLRSRRTHQPACEVSLEQIQRHCAVLATVHRRTRARSASKTCLRW